MSLTETEKIMNPILLILLCLIPYILLAAWAMRNIREEKRLNAAKQKRSEWRQLTEQEKDELDDFLTPLRFPEPTNLDQHKKSNIMKYSVIHSNDPYLLARMATDLQMEGIKQVLINEPNHPYLDRFEWIGTYADGEFGFYLHDCESPGRDAHELTESNYFRC